MPKNIERDFTLVAQVPDDVELGECEVVIHKATVSYRGITLRYDDDAHGADDVGIVVLSTRFVNPDSGEELESD